jgi:hypothetical protein
MAKRRWELDRQRREKLAALTAKQYPNRIVRRIVVVDQEKLVREAVIWEWDSRREAARKLRAVLRAPRDAVTGRDGMNGNYGADVSKGGGGGRGAETYVRAL